MWACLAILLTKVVHAESPENGENEAKRSRREEVEEEDCRAEQDRIKTQEEQVEVSLPGTVEAQIPAHTSPDVEMNTGNIPPSNGSLTMRDPQTCKKKALKTSKRSC